MNIPLRGHLMTRDIRNAIINHYGFKLVSFPPFEPFEYLTKKQIERLKEPILRCIDLVIGELTSAVQKSTQCVSVYAEDNFEYTYKMSIFVTSFFKRFRNIRLYAQILKVKSIHSSLVMNQKIK